MIIKPPDTWEEVPNVVATALEDYVRFVKRAADSATSPSGEPAQPPVANYDSLPLIRELADITGWRAGPINANWGGPRPLTNTLIGAGLGALGGYGAGWLAEQLSPEDTFEEGVPRKRWAMLGGVLGGLPGALQGIHNLTQGAMPWDHWPAKKSAVNPAAQLGLFQPVINRDQFVNNVMADPNTPLGVRAATAGLVEAASRVADSKLLTPLDVSRIAFHAGSGAVSGLLVGRVLGALAGLHPKQQKTLQETGYWAGALQAVVPNALGLR